MDIHESSKLHYAYYKIVTRSVIDENGCWLWQGGRTSGYGQIRVHGRREVCHRVTYKFIKGDIPDGLELDHICRVRHCVNPDHVEPVTHATNIFRAALGQRNSNTCKYGHEWTPDNTYIRDDNGQIHRQCKMCARISRERKKMEKDIEDFYKEKNLVTLDI